MGVDLECSCIKSNLQLHIYCFYYINFVNPAFSAESSRVKLGIVNCLLGLVVVINVCWDS